MKRLATRILPIMGLLFIIAYIRSATVDVVYTDYIRIINSYLPDAWSFKPYLQGDILTRVPISYIERIISTYIFGYSTTFDMIMGAIGLTLSAFVLTNYSNRKNVSAGVIVAILFIVFSLDKWEMFTNGTGWMHFWAFALFYLHYNIYDKVRSGEDTAVFAGKSTVVGNNIAAGADKNIREGAGMDIAESAGRNVRKSETWLCVLPFVTILLFAGPYCVIYAGAMGIVYVIDYFSKNYDTQRTTKKDWILRAVCLAVPFILFCISKYLSVDEYAGATNETLMQVIRSDITLIPKMVLKSFASMVIGGETAMEYGISNKVLYLMGAFVIASYAYAIYVNIKTKLYKKTAFPMLLIISGLISHAIVVWGRWIFKSPDYMMSSRYALQFQSGIIGIILTFYMAWEKGECRGIKRAFRIVFMVVIIGGHLVTTGREIHMAQYRKAAFENVREVALNYENETDETLKAVLQYSKPDMTRNALKILQDENLNIFR